MVSLVSNIVSLSDDVKGKVNGYDGGTHSRQKSIAASSCRPHIARMVREAY